MQVGDRVKYDPRFVEKCGDRFPFDKEDQGEIEEKGETKMGKTVYLVAWDSQPFNPQQADESWLVKV